MKRFFSFFLLLASLGACGAGKRNSKLPMPTGYPPNESVSLSQDNIERILSLNGQTQQALIIELGKMRAEGLLEASLRKLDNDFIIKCDLNRCNIERKEKSL